MFIHTGDIIEQTLGTLPSTIMAVFCRNRRSESLLPLIGPDALRPAHLPLHVASRCSQRSFCLPLKPAQANRLLLSFSHTSAGSLSCYPTCRLRLCSPCVCGRAGACCGSGAGRWVPLPRPWWISSGRSPRTSRRPGQAARRAGWLRLSSRRGSSSSSRVR